MSNITKDLELAEPEIEATPEASGLLEAKKEGINDMIELAENIDKLIDAQNKIRSAVMRLAQPGDWVLFGDGNGGKAEMGFAGAMRIGSTLGVSFQNFEMKKEIGRDEIGEWYRWECECDAVYRGRVIRVYGRAGSRDKFFGKAKGEYRPIHEVDEGNIKIVCRRSAMKEGVKVLFGLHHIDPKFVEKYGIKMDSAGGHTFKSQEKQAEEMKSVTVGIAESKLEKWGKSKTTGKDWKLYKITDKEGVDYWSFSSSAFDEAKNAQTSGANVTITYKVNDKGQNTVETIALSEF